jgi:hypothetical protein
MRIVSSFHDYYDRALAHGHDDRLVFVRESRRLGTKDSGFNAFTSLVDLLPGGTQRRAADTSVTMEPYHVVVGTHAYPGIAMNVQQKGSAATTRMAYAAEDFTQYLTALSLRADDKAAGSFDRIGHLVAFLERAPLELPAGVTVEKRIALMLVRNSSIVLNPSLKSLEFFRRMGAQEVFQELEMYLGGVLAPENRPMVAIEDKYRIAQHGFDRNSFRRPPQKRST